ncbi:MucR family transcriptional regulator [Pararhizobium sp. BT-229]|uniref:MucR family transcriptional regulator n=1 Tax=Pararhizobium sp. BT-229 TaxID=2986923 RepID=UPI0021F72C7D|nr:MucR family transcriptional regulator [Pararhizobium sp. BT-229]MCV9965098.1 MucR family transcriptional regulator [Pararhizobium sp. BT-229]
MTQAVLYVNESGRASINAAAIMESAIALVFNTTDPDDIDSLTIPERIDSAHVAILGIAAKLLANGMTGPAPRALPETPVAEAQPAGVVEQKEVVVAFTPAPAAAAAVPVAVEPTLPQPTARILELPLERPVQPRKQPTAKATPQAKRQAETPAARIKPAQETFPLGEVAPFKAKERPAPKRRRADVEPPKAKLPRRLSKKEDALKMDTIVCLEDGQKVVDLGKHLEGLGMTPEQYQRKWELSDSYPMKAPSVIQKRGIEYEYDPIHKRLVKTV